MATANKTFSDKASTEGYLHLMASALPEGYEHNQVYEELSNLVDFYEKPLYNCDFVRACKFYVELKPIFGVPVSFDEFEKIFGDVRFLCNIPSFRGKYLENIIFDPLSAMLFGICRVMENKK